LADRARSLEGGQWSKVDWRQTQGATAVESVGPLRGGNALRQLVMLKGRRFVSLAFLGPAASVNGREVQRFFNSLKLQYPMSKPRIHILALGGTIATRPDATGAMQMGLGADDLVAAVPLLAKVAEIQAE